MYAGLGIDARKQKVREIFEKLNDNECPGAFVNIITDPYCDQRVLTQHQDGDGSKFIQRMIHYLETGDEQVFCGMADDALSMNTGDIAASGFVFGPWIITDVLNLALPKELKEVVMMAVASRLLELKELYSEHGFKIKFLGGETADLPDQVRSGVFDIAITAWADKADLIAGNIQDGDLIFGFPSDGRASWEQTRNSGIMSNGLTLARSCLMSKRYNEKYPNLKRSGKFYKGQFDYNDYPKILNGMSVGEALLSPTRQWAIVIKEIITALKEVDALHMLHGISMNTGGGATKISNLGSGGILYKKVMSTPPPFFHLIKEESSETWKNMFVGLNCGIGIDIVGENNPIFTEALQKVSAKCWLPLHPLGSCQRFSDEPGVDNKVKLTTPFGSFEY
ncbi:MAG: hypothetical protein WCJ57_03840 [Candidatus Falkowbacteria bacterium]